MLHIAAAAILPDNGVMVVQILRQLPLPVLLRQLGRQLIILKSCQALKVLARSETTTCARGLGEPSQSRFDLRDSHGRG